MYSSAAGQPAGIYIHIPFCRQRCRYCDFYSRCAGETDISHYFDALVRALRNCPAGQTPADTVYFGGGTPPLLGAGRLAGLLGEIKKTFALAPDAEITLEANPASLTEAELLLLRSTGFNRISFGLQSAVQQELDALGRAHSWADAQSAVLAAQRAGFENISADLMLAVPFQTSESLAHSIRLIGSLPVRHISAYLLKVEPGTPLAACDDLLRTLPDEDETAQMYLDCVRQLAAAGFKQYEISNFAQPGYESRHNLKYWRCEPYIGLGPSAHSFFGGRRFAFPADLEAFCSAENPFALTVEQGSGGDAEEYAMLRLRLCEGLDLAEWERLYPDADTAAVLYRAAELEAAGLLRARQARIRLTPQGFLLSNRIIAQLLY